MKKIFPVTAVLFLFFHTVMAQDSDPAAVKLLKAVSQKYNNYKTMTMDVVLTIENLESKSTETKTGKAMIKGNMFYVNLDNQTIICDGKTIWTYVKDANEVQINNFEKGSDIMTPNDLFKVADKDYLVYMGEKASEGGKNLQVIELTPKNKSLSFSKVKLYINTADNSIVKGIVFDKNAIHFTYAISNFKTNADIANSTFTFDKGKYPGVDVIDLRE